MQRLATALLALATLSTVSLSVPATAIAQSPTLPAPNPFEPLHFLEGTWSANTLPTSTGAAGTPGPTLTGRYTFARELDGHILARHSTADPTCIAPSTFNCKHGDLLYIFTDTATPGAPTPPLQAIFFDNEGHTLHYTVSTPTPTSAVFLSDPIGGVRFRLLYDLQGTTLSGKFQLQPPGQTTWHSYLEWSGTRQ